MLSYFSQIPVFSDEIEPVYGDVTWPLIEHWGKLGILKATLCNPEGIDFSSWELSWNDEIDQLIKWATCYTAPEFKF